VTPTATGSAAVTESQLSGTCSPAELTRTVAALRAAQRGLAVRPRGQIVAALTDVVDAWLAPDSPWRARAEALLPEATGFSPEMVRFALPAMLEPLRAPALTELLADEATGRAGPPLILHVLPGNLPGLAAIPAVLSLAVGSAALLKAGRGDRIVPSLFADSVAARDAEIGACIAARYWPGGERACEDVALAAAELVVAAGDDQTIAALAARAPGRFLGHGHRLSFAAIGAEIVADAAARAAAATGLALDVAIWDQRGCLSPQLCFVEGDSDTAQRVAEEIVAALRPLAEHLPPARLSSAERLAVRRFHDEAEWRGLAGEAVRVLSVGGEGEGTVVVEPAARVQPTPLQRSLRVMPIGQLEELETLLAPVRGALEGAGLAAGDRQARLAQRLMDWGVHRVCGLGEMQRPPLTWRQGGRPRLADWVQG
jgi:hypothetical protein